MKKDDVKEKHDSPKKISDLRKNALSLARGEEDMNDYTTKGFMVIGDD